jgi:hypothetical protein
MAGWKRPTAVRWWRGSWPGNQLASPRRHWLRLQMQARKCVRREGPLHMAAESTTPRSRRSIARARAAPGHPAANGPPRPGSNPTPAAPRTPSAPLRSLERSMWRKACPACSCSAACRALLPPSRKAPLGVVALVPRPLRNTARSHATHLCSGPPAHPAACPPQRLGSGTWPRAPHRCPAPQTACSCRPPAAPRRRCHLRAPPRPPHSPACAARAKPRKRGHPRRTRAARGWEERGSKGQGGHGGLRRGPPGKGQTQAFTKLGI